MENHHDPGLCGKAALNWGAHLCTYYDKHAVKTAPLPVRTLVMLLHRIRSKAAEYGTKDSSPSREIQARVIASATGYHQQAARWILHALYREELVQFAAAIGPLRAAFDRHGKLLYRIRSSDATAAAGIVRHFALAYGATPADALSTILATAETERFDRAAAHRAFITLSRMESGLDAQRSTIERFDWALAVEQTFDSSGRPTKKLDRADSSAMLAAITREANSGAVKCAFEAGNTWPATISARQNRRLRRACVLLHERTHLASPVSAIVVIAALRSASKSSLMFTSLARLA